MSFFHPPFCIPAQQWKFKFLIYGIFYRVPYLYRHRWIYVTNDENINSRYCNTYSIGIFSNNGPKRCDGRFKRIKWEKKHKNGYLHHVPTSTTSLSTLWILYVTVHVCAVPKDILKFPVYMYIRSLKQTEVLLYTTETGHVEIFKYSLIHLLLDYLGQNDWPTVLGWHILRIQVCESCSCRRA